MAVRPRRPASDPYAPRRFEPEERPTAPDAMSRRRSRAVFTAPPLFRQRGDGDLYDASRPLFPQRRPPQLQEFGAGDDTHAVVGNTVAERAKAAARHAITYAYSGECSSANDTLSYARAQYAVAVTHSQSGGRGIELGTVDATYQRAKGVFEQKCKVIKRKGR